MCMNYVSKIIYYVDNKANISLSKKNISINYHIISSQTTFEHHWSENEMSNESVDAVICYSMFSTHHLHLMS